MKVYYITNEKCVDVSGELIKVSIICTRAFPFVAVGLTAVEVARKMFIVGTGVYGSVTFFEFLGLIPGGTADRAYSQLYDTFNQMVQNGMVK